MYSLCFMHVASSPLRLISLKEETNDLDWRERDAYLSSGSLMDTQAAASATAYDGHGSGFALRRHCRL